MDRIKAFIAGRPPTAGQAVRSALERAHGIRIEFRILLFLAFLLLAASPAYNHSRAASQLKLADLPFLSLDVAQRILVVAPHPDDETLGAGGLIQAARSQGKDVRILILTNGDGQPFAPLAIDRHLGSRASDFIAMGTRRQMEALSAITQLGLAPGQVDFLGYPDRGLMPLWLQSWKRDCPYRSYWTRSTATPYANAYRPDAPHCGSELLQDLKSYLMAYQPDLVVIPHPNDDHPDHRAAANYTRLALTLIHEQAQAYQPAVLGYLIHYGYFPQPRGSGSNAPLLPPIPLSGPDTSWLRLDLEDEQVQSKARAIRSHASQVRLLGSFLTRFSRRNELFASLPVEDLSLIEYDSLQLQETGVDAFPLVGSANESLRRYLIGGADLVGWHAARVGNILFLTADTRGGLLPGLQYRILLKTPDGETHVYQLKGTQVTRAFSSFTAHIDLSEIGNPAGLSFAAEVRQKAVLDRTGWSFLILQDAVSDLIEE